MDSGICAGSFHTEISVNVFCIDLQSYFSYVYFILRSIENVDLLYLMLQCL